MTPEQEAELRRLVHTLDVMGAERVRPLLDALDAARGERDEARAALARVVGAVRPVMAYALPHFRRECAGLAPCSCELRPLREVLAALPAAPSPEVPAPPACPRRSGCWGQRHGECCPYCHGSDPALHEAPPAGEVPRG